MSVIHEALKRAQKDPVFTLRSGRASSAWLWWLMLFFVLAEGAFFVRERALRRKAEEKMKQAFLQLNDARGDSLSRVEDLRNQLKKAILDKAELSSSKRSVELENLEKEKKISELTKSLHQVEMSKFQLKEEVQGLKRELSKWSSPLPIQTESAQSVSTEPSRRS